MVVGKHYAEEEDYYCSCEKVGKRTSAKMEEET